MLIFYIFVGNPEGSVQVASFNLPAVGCGSKVSSVLKHLQCPLDQSHVFATQWSVGDRGSVLPCSSDGKACDMLFSVRSVHVSSRVSPGGHT